MEWFDLEVEVENQKVLMQVRSMNDQDEDDGYRYFEVSWPKAGTSLHSVLLIDTSIWRPPLVWTEQSAADYFERTRYPDTEWAYSQDEIFNRDEILQIGKAVSIHLYSAELKTIPNELTTHH